MNRDGTDEPEDGVTVETPTPATDEGGDNVIAFPGSRVRPVPAPAEEGLGESASEAEAERPAEEPGMTLDAFERAVRSAVREKLGPEGAAPDARPQGADELVAQVFSALTGKDAKTALSEVRQRLAEPIQPDDGGADDVIDLGAVREARQRASLESAQRFGGALKDTFSQFLATLAQRQGGQGDITLDAGFFKQHGGALLGNLFQGLASALMQQNAPARPSEPPATTPEAKAESGDGAESGSETAGSEDGPSEAPRPGPAEPAASSVQVKLDLGSILASLFRRRDAPPPEPKS